MVYADLVKETSTTTGTGAIALAGTSTGFRTFAQGFTVGATMPYEIRDAAGNVEIGVGTLTGSTTLTRNAVTYSTNSNALVNFPAGSKDVFCMVSAAQIAAFQVSQDIAFSTTIPLTVAGTQYMPQQTVASVLAFTAASSPVKGASVYVRLLADGTNAPTFTGMKEWGGSLGYDNRNGIPNIIQFFYDGTDAFYSVSQPVGAVPVAPAATAITMSGPTSGTVSVASTNFSVGVTPVGGTITGTVTVTLSDGGAGGTFNPATVPLTTAAPTATFTYTPNATAGAKTISATNNGSLTNPANITYTANAVATVPRLTALNAMNEGGTSPNFTYTGTNAGGGGFLTKGGLLNLHLPSGSDGSFALRNTSGQEFIMAIPSSGAATGVETFSTCPFALWTGSTGGNYGAFSTGAAQTALNTVASQANDIMRMRFSSGGTVLTAEVARAATPTTFTPIYTWTGLTPAVQGFEVNALACTLDTITCTGLS